MKTIRNICLAIIAAPAITATVAYFGIWKCFGNPPSSYVGLVRDSYEVLYRLFF